MAAFLLPSSSAPPLTATALMAVAGLAWGGFSLLGRAADSPVASTVASFLLASPLALLLVVIQSDKLRMDTTGIVYAVLSRSLASGVGYAIWYWVHVRIAAISARAVQLSVPVLSAVLGTLILGE